MTGPTHATPDAEQAAPQPVPVEPQGAAMAPIPLMVGHAEDRAEHEADAMADTALDRLRRLEGDTHSHGPGCDHSTVSRGEVRRSAAPPSGAPVVGYAGGALDTGTSDAIESRRGAGRALDADVRRRMETAFNTSFSSVRIHDDAPAAKLNSAVSATAFTTGKDIFFGSRQYAPGTPGGDRVLAHELAHTLQPEEGPRRTVAVAPGVSPMAQAAIVRSVATTHTVRRGIFDSIFGKKKPAATVATPGLGGGKGGGMPGLDTGKAGGPGGGKGGGMPGLDTGKAGGPGGGKGGGMPGLDTGKAGGPGGGKGGGMPGLDTGKAGGLSGGKGGGMPGLDTGKAGGLSGGKGGGMPGLDTGKAGGLSGGKGGGMPGLDTGKAGGLSGGKGGGMPGLDTGQGGGKPQPPGFKGKGGALPSTAVEGTKGGIVGGVVGGAGAAGQFGSAAAPMLGGLTGGAAGVLTTADAMMGLANADAMADEASTYGDAGMWNLAGRKGKNQGMQAVTGAASVAKGGVEMGYLASAGSANVAKSMAAGAGSVGLGVAAGGLGVAVGSLQTAQGLWRSGKAVQKLCRLAWGRSKDMYSDRGKTSWKPAVLSAEKFKLGVGIVKTALGVLGIAAGALLIVSNPIGWGIGIAAAIAGGVYAATKIAAKISDAKARTRIAEKIQNGNDADVIVGEGTTKTVGDAKKSAAAKTAQSNKRSDKKHPDGEKSKDEHHARNDAIEKANEIARMASSTAVIASEMRDRMLWADDGGNQRTWRLLENAAGGDTKTAAEDQDGLDMTWAGESDKELFDAYMLLSSINVSREEAVSPMGQELIEKKLSKMESM